MAWGMKVLMCRKLTMGSSRRRLGFVRRLISKQCRLILFEKIQDLLLLQPLLNILLLLSRVSSPKINTFLLWTKRQSPSESIPLRTWKEPKPRYVYCKSFQRLYWVEVIMAEGLCLEISIVRMVPLSTEERLWQWIALCRAICSKTHSIVANVGYRHAPEFPYPMPLEDAYVAALWVTRNSAKQLTSRCSTTSNKSEVIQPSSTLLVTAPEPI